MCVCVCVFERGKRKEGKGGTRGLFGCACRRALCVCMQQVCMHEERLTAPYAHIMTFYVTLINSKHTMACAEICLVAMCVPTMLFHRAKL